MMMMMTPIGAHMGTRPQNGTNFHFLVKSCPAAANPLTDFYNFKGLLYTQLPRVSVLHVT